MALTPEQQAMDFNPELQDVSRQRKLADLLMSQGMQQPQGQMISGHYVAPSWTQQLNPMANILAGQAVGERADTKQTEMAQALRKQGNAAVQKVMATFKENPELGVQEAAQLQQYPQVKALFPTLAKALELTPEERQYKAAIADGSFKGGFNAFKNQMTDAQKESARNERIRTGIAQSTFAADYGMQPQSGGLPQGGAMPQGSGLPQGNRMPQGGMQTVSPGSPILTNPNMPSYAQGTPIAGINTAPINTAGLLPKEVRGIQAGLAKETAESQQAKITSAISIAPTITAIEKLLPNSTSGGAKTLLKQGYEFTTGKPTTSSGVDAQLDVLGAKLTAEVPRFKGMDSDKDVIQYKTAAGDVANTNKPWQSRMAALQIIKNLSSKYAPDVYKDMINPAEAAPSPTEAPRTSLSNTWQIIKRSQ